MSAVLTLPERVRDSGSRPGELAAPSEKANADEALRLLDRWLDELAEACDQLQTHADRDDGPDAGEPQPEVEALWGVVCDALRIAVQTQSRLAGTARGFWSRRPPDVAAAIGRLADEIEQLIDLIRYVQIVRPDWGLDVPDDLAELVWTVRVSPQAYLRTMWSLFWSAIRHPLSDTTIDVSTGKVLYRTP